MNFETFTNLDSFIEKVLSHITERLTLLSIDDLPLFKNKLNLIQEHDLDKYLKTISYLSFDTCKNRINPDFLASIFLEILERHYDDNYIFYTLSDDHDILSFIIVNHEMSTPFLEMMKEDFKQEQNTTYLQRFLTSFTNISIYTISIICSKEKGKGKQLLEQVISSYFNNPSILFVSHPIKKLKDYYQNHLHFIYEDDIIEYYGLIYKILE